MNVNFINSLKNNDFELFKSVPKSNYHTHALLSSNRYNFFKEYNRRLNKFKNSDKIQSISLFIKENILDISTSLSGQLKMFELTIKTAIDNGVTILGTSVDYRLLKDFYKNNYNNYIKDLTCLKEKYKNRIIINFDLGISRNAYDENDYKIIIDLIKTNFFYGIDLYGDELSKDIRVFKKIYRIAKKNNLILKAHVGEFGDAKSIYTAVKILKLDVVQHGINIVNDKRYMKKLKKRKTVFNICPISNVKLNRIKTIKKHPIKEMFEYGLIVTINTDDELIFENSIFDEYKLLYINNVLSANDLDTIRRNSLDMF